MNLSRMLNDVTWHWCQIKLFVPNIFHSQNKMTGNVLAVLEIDIVESCCLLQI